MTSDTPHEAADRPADRPSVRPADRPTAPPGGDPGFRTVLVANRGEIACRVIGTLRRLGVRSVAVFSDADADARHVREADVAVRIGPAPATQSYLDVDAVVAAAVATGAEAVHPGYGFLSENPALARACERAGIAFVGPGVDALEAMADKLAAKRIVGARGVPVVPGAGEPGMPDDDLLAAARGVGFPLLVKPSAGGGGKGMVVVRTADDLSGALASARRVAGSSFGDDTLLLERLVEAPRHIEVQVLADTHGTVVHLGERECSLQRRHQKVVEEAPSPLLTPAQRARMGEAACEVARSVGYVGAGTVEFLVPAADPDAFFFIEMNTRLQVEHPVTEMVTGLDLVELQLRVAAGAPLGIAQDDVVLRGHAVEARLYAESPERGFLPATGSVLVYDDDGVPAGPGASPLRLDSGIAAGAVVSGYYDPMLAKAVAWGETRDEAVDRLDGLLARTVVLGVETNTAFLRSLLADPDVRAGRLDTGLIDRLVSSGSGPVLGSGEGPGVCAPSTIRALVPRALPPDPTTTARTPPDPSPPRSAHPPTTTARTPPDSSPPRSAHPPTTTARTPPAPLLRRSARRPTASGGSSSWPRHCSSSRLRSPSMGLWPVRRTRWAVTRCSAGERGSLRPIRGGCVTGGGSTRPLPRGRSCSSMPPGMCTRCGSPGRRGTPSCSVRRRATPTAGGDPAPRDRVRCGRRSSATAGATARGGSPWTASGSGCGSRSTCRPPTASPRRCGCGATGGPSRWPRRAGSSAPRGRGTSAVGPGTTRPARRIPRCAPRCRARS
ncbi:hypothetical protein CBR64_09520 [Cellulosimicrobium cellulans]|uniref:biotin carboxylase n=1 Tax=Cellulosimicrobium cellulans TaxID=1710 RepID=A0A1Y0HWL1_CELCE|nr:biotin carboxylase N-terminal domain-containing protein [Cellulosimicrobium cellulans]ARU51685.1 hypothetical protein CBR64_09520 [Cellulosimicrobium cellulans]